MALSRARTLAPFGLAGAVVLSLAIAAPAAGHNFIVSSTPTEGEVLTSLPEQWQITTNETLLDLGGQGAGFALLVSDDAGGFYGDGCVVVEGESLSMPAALGTDGAYTLTYQFISADGHTLSGELPFSWQAPAGFEPHVGLAEPPVCGETASAPAPAQSSTLEQTEDPVQNPGAADSAEADATNGDFAGLFWILGGAVAALAFVGTTIAIISRSRRQPPG